MSAGSQERCAIVRDGIAIGLATGAYGVSFGALGVAAGLSVLQTCALSLLMFTGASQFAFVGLIGGGAAPATATALLLGTRNAFYGLRIGEWLPRRRGRRALAAQLVIDESAALALGQDRAELATTGFWAAGLGVYVFWNLGTLAGALGGQALPEPEVLGLDAAAPAAFIALLAPRVQAQGPLAIAGLAAVAALAVVPFTPLGVPVLVAAVVAVLAGLLGRR